MANRKDAKGRVLKTGESQRKDGTYMYRYTDIRGKRKSVYAGDLKELREKEKDVQKDLNDKIDYDAGKITAINLIKKYLAAKDNLKESTEMNYDSMVRVLEKYDVFYYEINKIKSLDARECIHQMLQDGKKSSTVQSYLRLVEPAFDQACEDNIIHKNPFKLKPSDYMKDDRSDRVALTPEQQEKFLEFARVDIYGKRHYDDYNILLGTGLRISEYLGITMNDIDLVNRVLHVTHQLFLTKDGQCKITSLKSKNGKRDLYISDNIYESIIRKIHDSHKKDKGVIIDGYKGFLNISNDGLSIIRRNSLNSALKTVVKRYNERNADAKLPYLTPHILRHTFCTNMVMGGIDIKSLQYVMGHADVNMALKVYAHVNAVSAVDKMKKIAESKSNLAAI